MLTRFAGRKEAEHVRLSEDSAEEEQQGAGIYPKGRRNGEG